MSETSSIGKPTKIIDGRAKVTGTARFTPDLYMPGMLHARFVTSLHPHANITAIHTEDALAVPGVVAVLTANDMPDIAPSSRDRLLLARGRVMYTGQPIAMVLANDEAAAEDGVDKVSVDYETLPAAITLDEALADDAPLVWPLGIPDESGAAGAHGASSGSSSNGKRETSNIAGESSYSRGDVNAGFAEADMIVERVFDTPVVHQSALETQAIIAQPEPATGGITMWVSTQAPFDVRKAVAKTLGILESDVRVIGMSVGGGFGGKNGLLEPLVAAAARAVGRPVRLIMTRMEESLTANPAPPIRIHAKLGAKADGTITAMEADIFLDAGCYPFGLAGFVGYMLGSFYQIPNFQINASEVLTFKPSAGAYRAPGAPSCIFAIDCLIDELAQGLGLDGIEMRLQNASHSGDRMAEDNDKWPGMGMSETLEALRNHPAWQNREQARAAGRGVGIAVGGWLGGTEPAAALCTLHRDGQLHIHVGSVDISGTMTGFTLMAAETFGVAPENVRIIYSDTETAPYAGASAGSKVTYTTGAAVVTAVKEARQQALAIAADELEAAVEDLEIVDGKVQVRGVPSKAIPLGKIASKTMNFGGKYKPVFSHGSSAQQDSAPTFSAQLAEVEVDKETGEVHLHRLVVVQDVGRAINPAAINGQLMGGATQGIGWALYESMIYDEGGQLVTGSWMDYAIPKMTHSARVLETVIVEVPSETGPFGVRGVGEAPVVPTAAAIANAIADATGVRMTELPMTAPRVLQAIEQNGATTPNPA